MPAIQKTSIIAVLASLVMLLPACDQQKTAKAKEKPASTPIYSKETLDKVEKDVNKALQESIDRINSAVDGKK